MADLPSGQWSHLLVGHQWPGSGTLAILSAAAASRAMLGTGYEGYADVLQSIRTGVLDSQHGVTAESARESFRSGESSARNVASRNLAKHQSYTSAHQWIAELRADLASIAASGNSEIQRILESDAPAPQKISAIVQTVTEAQTHANTSAASCSANLCDAIQTVLTAGDGSMSARELARTNGIDLQRAFGSPNPAFIHDQVSAIMAEPSTISVPATGGTDTGMSPVPVPESPGPVSPGSESPGSQSLAGNIADGAVAGAPLARGAEALAAAAVGALHPESDSGAVASGATAPTDPAVRPTEVAGSPPVLSPVTAVAAATALTAVAPATALTTVAPATPVNTVTPATPAGPLPGYGAELRPTKSAAPPLLPPLPAAPAAAVGTGAAAGATALAHSTTMRPAPAPAITIANALGAVAAGAVAGTAVARTAADARLHRLLNAVARQEPGLRWAIGERSDGSTLLVTDLANGWVPPHITIPTGVVLLKPASLQRSGTGAEPLSALLGSTVRTAIYDPDLCTAPEDEGEPVAMSIAARRTAAVDDLAWELAQATRWRDGLPRLAHTLARAAWGRTGCLESEITLLRDHLDAIAGTVLNSYPDDVVDADVANWQLLATVEALVDESPTLADYHFAWFHARATMDTSADFR